MKLCVESFCFGLRGSRRAVPGGGSCWGGRRVRRLRCGARSRVAPQNSLRAPWALRSDNRGESVVEARKRADPGPALLTAPEIAPAGYRPPRVQPLVVFPPNTKTDAAKVRSGRSEGASEAEPGHRQSSGLAVPGEEPGHWPGAACKGLRSTGLVARARSALRALTCRRMFERSAAKQAERVRRRGHESEHRKAVGQGPRRGPFVALRPTASAKPSGLPGRAFARTHRRTSGAERHTP